MPLIGNVTNNYYTNTELLVEMLGKLNYIDMSLQTLNQEIQNASTGLALVNEKLEAEKLQIDAKFAELNEQIAGLVDSEAVLAAAETLRTQVVDGLTTLGQSIESIIPDAPVDPPVDPDPVDPPVDNGEG